MQFTELKQRSLIFLHNYVRTLRIFENSRGIGVYKNEFGRNGVYFGI